MLVAVKGILNGQKWDFYFSVWLVWHHCDVTFVASVRDNGPKMCCWTTWKWLGVWQAGPKTELDLHCGPNPTYLSRCSCGISSTLQTPQTLVWYVLWVPDREFLKWLSVDFSARHLTANYFDNYFNLWLICNCSALILLSFNTQP